MNTCLGNFTTNERKPICGIVLPKICIIDSIQCCCKDFVYKEKNFSNNTIHPEKSSHIIVCILGQMYPSNNLHNGNTVCEDLNQAETVTFRPRLYTESPGARPRCTLCL